MRPPSSLFLRLPLSAALLSVLACSKKPAAPAACVVDLPELAVEWQLSPLRFAGDLDSLRLAITRSKDGDARGHLIQEYLLAANQLGTGPKGRAIASLEQSLGMGGSAP